MPRKQKQYHYIYKTTCNVTSRYYYGMHSTNNLDDGYLGSGKRLWKSINKYGKENHSIEILEFLQNRKELINREKEIITESFLEDPMCMNLMKGGKGGYISIENQKNRSIAGVNGFRNKLKNDIKFKENFSKHCSERASINHKIGLLNIPNWTGKKHKKETKLKIGEANANTQKGSKNSQFGTMWITNGVDNKKVDKTSEIPEGWKKGRIIKAQ